MEASPETRKNANITSSQKADDDIVFQVGVHEMLGAHNNPHMFVCRLDEFLKHYRPSEPVLDDDAYRCLEVIISGGLAVNSEDGGYLWTVPPTFDLLKGIINCVLDFVKKDSQKKDNMQFMLVHHDNAGSSCFIAEPLLYPNTKFTDGDNNASTDVERNRSVIEKEKLHLRILGACHHIMSKDIRRMWIYGLTFEDNLCTLWYFSRTHSVKTKAFDWFKDPQSLVRVLLAFAKATPRELGMDPTVHLVLEGEDKRTSFVYEVPVKNNGINSKRYYKTLDSISETRDMAIAGKTTRIWKVVEVTDADGKHLVESTKGMVLKDVWVSTDKTTEGQNLDAIFAAVDKYVDSGVEAQKQKQPAWNEKQWLQQLIQEDPRFRSFDSISVNRLVANLTNKAYRNLFLTKIHDWQGETCKAVGENVWHDPNFFSTSSLADLMKDDTNLTEAIKSKDPKSTQRTLMAHDATVPTWGENPRDEFDGANRPRSFAPKRQSRFIYREMCTTLQNLGTVGEVVDVLYQTMDAMHILFLAGWVHRDISSSNIMAYRSDPKKPWAVKLADLEFARLMVDPTRQGNVDPRTGTPYFMPVEVLNGKYLLDASRIYSPSHNPALSDKSNPLDQSRPMQKFGLLKQSALTHRNLAVQLNASTVGQDYVDNLKHFKVFPGEVKMSDIQLKPRWDDVPKLSATVNYNYQHDLESIWWILLWIITCRIGHEASARAMEDYFKNNMKNSKARSALLQQFLTEYDAGLHEHILPFWPVLEDLRQSMHKASLMRPVFGHLKVPEAYSSIQAQFSQLLRIIRADDGPWRDIRLQHGSDSQTQKSIVITQDPLKTTGKRECETTTEDQNAAKRLRQ